MKRCVVASYNIHRCIGLDGRSDPDRVASVLQEIDADIVGLQEVESYVGEGDGVHQLNYLAEEAGYHAIAGSTILRSDSHYGNALFTRFPPLDVRTFDVSIKGFEPRGIIDVDLDVHGNRLRVLVTHLGLIPSERRRQTKMLLNTVMAHPDEPVVILCDFNEWFPWGRPLRWMHNRLGSQPRINTFPARFPLIALDRIWVAPRKNLASISAHNSPLAQIASDHLPLRATVNLELAPGR
jgi:endonuclease/exonuclease/phosphatase family metal-dependent hydrolase